jgi:hypothetical protein
MTDGADARDPPPFRLLMRLFLRRFVENDLISPHADRHESLAVLLAVIASVAVFVTFFVSLGYLSTFILLPGEAALSALGDRFLFIGASLVICALGALAVWDALALEGRDTNILGPLPIPVRTITYAKLAAAVVFGSALAVALNAVSTVIYPAFFTKNIRGVRGLTVLHLIAAHGTTVTMAGLFGFFAIVAIRGALHLVLSDRSFSRASSAAQTVLVVFMVTALLMTLRVRATDVRGWVSGATVTPIPAHPVLWYLGLNEAEAGHTVADAPLVLPPGIRAIPLRVRRADENAREIYRGMRDTFATDERRAWLSVLAATGLALATFLWTNRRLPDRSARAPGASRMGRAVRRLVERRTRGDTEAQAGLFFAYQTMVRSAPHRTILAIALAIGLTDALVVLAQNTHGSGVESIPLGVLGISTMLTLLLAGGLYYAATVPAEPRANWTIRMAWLGDERAYLRGVRRAGLLLLCAPLVLLLPLHIALLGMADAVIHTLFGVAFAIAAIDGLFLLYRKLPFACGYVPIENPKIVWPAAFAGLLLTTHFLAMAERWALETGTGEIALGTVLAATVILLRAIDSTRRRERKAIDFDGLPTPPTQRLGLSAHISG